MAATQFNLIAAMDHFPEPMNSDPRAHRAGMHPASLAIAAMNPCGNLKNISRH